MHLLPLEDLSAELSALAERLTAVAKAKAHSHATSSTKKSNTSASGTTSTGSSAKDSKADSDKQQQHEPVPVEIDGSLQAYALGLARGSKRNGSSAGANEEAAMPRGELIAHSITCSKIYCVIKTS